MHQANSNLLVVKTAVASAAGCGVVIGDNADFLAFTLYHIKNIFY